MHLAGVEYTFRAYELTKRRGLVTLFYLNPTENRTPLLEK
jgi:hypothetical protein